MKLSVRIANRPDLTARRAFKQAVSISNEAFNGSDDEAPIVIPIKRRRKGDKASGMR
jgi:hypothetical protein